MTATAKKKTPKKSTARWSIGLFRNASGKLVTVYVTTDGEPMPYERDRVNGRILFHTVFSGMKYSQARQRLIKDSGLKDEPVAVSANGKAMAKKAKAKRGAK